MVELRLKTMMTMLAILTFISSAAFAEEISVAGGQFALKELSPRFGVMKVSISDLDSLQQRI